MTTIRIPASTSNLGAGFDTLGLALKLYLDVDVLSAGDGESRILDVEGEGAHDIPRGRDNLILQAYEFAAMREAVYAPQVHLRVRNQIPLARGLGSSAAAIVAGLSVFEAATDRDLGPKLLAYGMEFEGHGDNLAASILGGFVTVCPGAASPLVVRREWPAELRVVLVIPDRELSTAAARAVLPTSVLRADAVFNLQRLSLLHAALAERRWDLVGEALRDRLHQPYREALLPGLAEALAVEPGGHLAGVALSGAGSTVLALATGDFDRIGALVAGCFAVHGIAASVRVLDVDGVGRAFTRRKVPEAVG